MYYKRCQLLFYKTSPPASGFSRFLSFRLVSRQTPFGAVTPAAAAPLFVTNRDTPIGAGMFFADQCNFAELFVIFSTPLHIMTP
jgi:hypothetical protein